MVAKSTLRHFDVLTDRGLKVIPIRENSKIPLCRGWSKNWELKQSRIKILQYPDSNIGILLGEYVDVEGDSQCANDLLLDMIGDYPHPSYRSSKSIHHLFLNPDNLRIIKYKDIEFRGHGHQSVLPPSQHHDISYRWEENPQFPAPEMPERLLKFLDKIKNNDKKQNKQQAKIWCGKCSKKIYVNRIRLDREIKAFQLLDSKWECLKCRIVDIRSLCRRIKRQ